jgi:3-ketosteroid 9alpha-monooxygenase subunit B
MAGRHARPIILSYFTWSMTEQYPDATNQYYPLSVKRVIQETADSCSLVFEIPATLRDRFAYKAGQFLTFRIPVAGQPLLRCYSMSSSPDTDPDMKVTIKRIVEGRVSNWINDQVREGDILQATAPAGRFCLRDRDTPIVAFSGGSAITPVISIIKTALATTSRLIKLLYANRDKDSIIFAKELDDLYRRYTSRLQITHHLDNTDGFIDLAALKRFISGNERSDFYICGPGPFMDLVEQGLADRAVDRNTIFIERFISLPDNSVQPIFDEDTAVSVRTLIEDVVFIIRRVRHRVSYRAGDTLLETARRAALRPPASCESGNCGTCTARVKAGKVEMRINNVLTPEEVAQGYVLTCQGRPTEPGTVVDYD